MRTLLIIPAILALTLAVSCKKKRTCTCTDVTTITQTYPNGTNDIDVYTSTSTVTAEKQTKKYFRMDNGCYSYTTKSAENHNGYNEVRSSEVSCTLK